MLGTLASGRCPRHSKCSRHPITPYRMGHLATPRAATGRWSAAGSTWAATGGAAPPGQLGPGHRSQVRSRVRALARGRGGRVASSVRTPCFSHCVRVSTDYRAVQGLGDTKCTPKSKISIHRPHTLDLPSIPYPSFCVLARARALWLSAAQRLRLTSSSQLTRSVFVYIETNRAIIRLLITGCRL